MINLGDKVKDTVSGFTGIAVCKCSYLQGCDRIAIQAPVNKNGEQISWAYFDEPQLKVVKRKVIKQGKKDTGGYQPDNAERP